ncbi:MAG: Xaa-Pro dipeptidyl-peptidase, partial [Polaribacter sp.]
MKNILFILLFVFAANAQEKATPIFNDGEAQIVDAFKDQSKWIRTDLWVETTFDSDGDGKLDRMYVDVTRPMQTETEGLK